MPVVQPTFDRGSVGETFYHTQFDTAAVVDFDKSNEAVRLYGSLLLRLDQMALLPYDFVVWAEYLRHSVDWTQARAAGVADGLSAALERLETRARRLTLALAEANARGWPALASRSEDVDGVNQQLRAAARYLLTHCCGLGGDFSHQVMARHENSQHNLAVLEQAIAALEAGEARFAVDRLTDKKDGLAGGYLSCHASYPTYYHYTVGAANPGRPNLLWARGRALEIVDCWIVVRALLDKIARGATDFGAELHDLRVQREITARCLVEDYAHLDAVAETAATMLPLEAVQALL